MEFFNLKLTVSFLLAKTALVFIGAIIFKKWCSQYSMYVASYSLFFLFLEYGSKDSLYVKFTFHSSSKSDGIGTDNALQLNLSLLRDRHAKKCYLVSYLVKILGFDLALISVS